MSVRRFWFTLAVMAAASFGCAPSQTGAAGPSGGTANLGSISVQLQLATGVRLNAVDYQISGPAFTAKGTLNVANGTTISGVIADIPIGAGYTIDLTASDVENRLTGCHGSSPFDIAAGIVTAVAVHLICHDRAVPAPAPEAVPLPPAAMLALAALLLVCGVRAVRRL